MRRWKHNLLLSTPPFDTLAYTNKVVALSPIAYWPLAELTGSTAVDASGNGRNGAYAATALGQLGIGDGRNAALLDGATSFINIYSASLSGAFGSAEGTAALWMRVSGAGVWTDGTTRRLLCLQVDGSNRVRIDRTTTNGRVDLAYSAGGVTQTVSVTSLSSTNWLHFALTWSKAGDAVKGYLGGVQQSTTQTGLGVWAGVLASTATVAGAANTTPANVWSGYLAHVALWSTPLSGAQIATLAVIP